MPGVNDALLEWYSAHRRDLPWRRTTDPYAILVSEVMLQQTQVARVIERYEAWLKRWPTPASLAAASVAEVLAEWVGLGYNRRALRLRDACAVVAQHGWPQNLTELPGVGAYTAAALGAFAFGRDTVALDTNTRRLFGRLGRRLAPRPGGGPLFKPATIGLGAPGPPARAAAGGGAALQPGDDRARSAGLPRAGAEVRGVPVRIVLRVGGGRPSPAPAGCALRGHQPLGPRPRDRGARGGRAASGHRSRASGARARRTRP